MPLMLTECFPCLSHCVFFWVQWMHWMYISNTAGNLVVVTAKGVWSIMSKLERWSNFWYDAMVFKNSRPIVCDGQRSHPLIFYPSILYIYQYDGVKLQCLMVKNFSWQKLAYNNQNWQIWFILLRLEICRDRRDRWSCKIFVSCVNFSWKQCSFLHILQV